MDITITLDRSEQADYIYQQIYQKLKKKSSAAICCLTRRFPPSGSWLKISRSA